MRRIINIYNFIRAVEPRDAAVTREVLLDTAAQQVRLLKRHRLPATFALQYDALIDSRYQDLLKGELDARDEIGAWWEMVQPLVEKAGLKWRGRFPWDWRADVGFSPGYSPREREKLADVYMADFKEIFGAYPRTVGSWFIDEHSLAYLAAKYGVIASCNCKDQVGTDGYTLWGGYWNQAYYPSVKNAYMPAQNQDRQIPIPVFRMLGSDPIYQYDCGLGGTRQDVVSLEPVYAGGGGNPEWVRWFFDFTTRGPCLAFAYAQTGQENSFTWKGMARGMELQVPRIAELVRTGAVEVETLAATGEWFRSQFQVTPPTAVTVLEDWKNEGRKTVWYNSRFYRLNLLWEKDSFRVRDIHRFDEAYESPYLSAPLKSPECTYDTLPVLDGFHWSTADDIAGIRPACRLPDGGIRYVGVGAPVVREQGIAELLVGCPIEGGGNLEVDCREAEAEFRLTGGGKNDDLLLAMTWSSGRTPPIERVTAQSIAYRHRGYPYELRCGRGRFEARNPDGRGRPVGGVGNGVAMIPDQGVFALAFQ